MTTVHDALPVTRVTDATGGTHIEPDLDQRWAHVDQLRWLAGVVRADTGHDVKIVTDVYEVDGQPVPGVFGYSYAGHSGGAMRFETMWVYLGGLSDGVELERAAAAERAG